MTRLALILTLLAGPVWGQGPSVVAAGGDTIQMRASEANLAEVLYSNTGAQQSHQGVYDLEFEGVQIEAEIIVSAGAERIIIRPVDPGLLAVPPEATVEDGEWTTIQIMLPMF